MSRVERQVKNEGGRNQGLSKHGHSASMSIFYMRETLANLTQAMEQIAAEADQNQK